jgi:hypothetical protein
MAQVTILQRDTYVQYPAPGEVVDVVEVTFSSDLYGPATVALPIASYRPATPDELAANPRYRMLPVDAQAEEAERKAIQEAIQRQSAGPTHSFELP